MAHSALKKFIIKSLVVWLVPTAILVGLYVWADPMMDLRAHPNDVSDHHMPNKGMITLGNFRHYNPLTRFDSFIVGPSSTIAFHADDWARYLPDGARPFIFDSSSMSIEQLALSVDYISAHVDTLRNVLFVFFPHGLENEQTDIWGNVPFRTAPAIDPSPARAVSTHWMMLSHWYSLGNLGGWLVSKRDPALLEKFFANRYAYNTGVEVLDPTVNQEGQPTREAALDARADSLERADTLWYTRRQPYYNPYRQEPCLDEIDAHRLRHIARLLRARGTSYRFVFAPDKTGQWVHPADMAMFRQAFGDSLLDLSHPGSPAYPLINNPYNYLDAWHFTPRMARRILPYIYPNNNDH